MRFLAAISILGLVVCMEDSDESSVYILNRKDGKSYRVMYHALKWELAIEECLKDNATLAVPRSQREFDFIQQEIVRGMNVPAISGTIFKEVVFLGISNLGDHTVWRNIYGENIENTGYHTWTSGVVHYCNEYDPDDPHCVVMDAFNPGFRYWWCNYRQAFICEKGTHPDLAIASSPQEEEEEDK